MRYVLCQVCDPLIYLLDGVGRIRSNVRGELEFNVAGGRHRSCNMGEITHR
jgi:hypothetical protein